MIGRISSWFKRMVAKHRLALSLLGTLFVALILGFLIFMYPTPILNPPGGVIGVSWLSNHALAVYIYAKCYPYYSLSHWCFPEFNVTSMYFMGGSCALEHVTSSITWWINKTVLTYYCTTKPTAVVMNITCGAIHFNNYSIVISNGSEFNLFMC